MAYDTQMGMLLLNKYQCLIEDIEDKHFSSDDVREDMLRSHKGVEKGLTGDTLWRKLEKEMMAVKTFASKFPGVNFLHLSCQVARPNYAR